MWGLCFAWLLHPSVLLLLWSPTAVQATSIMDMIMPETEAEGTLSTVSIGGGKSNTSSSTSSTSSSTSASIDDSTDSNGSSSSTNSTSNATSSASGQTTTLDTITEVSGYFFLDKGGHQPNLKNPSKLDDKTLVFATNQSKEVLESVEDRYYPLKSPFPRVNPDGSSPHNAPKANSTTNATSSTTNTTTLSHSKMLGTKSAHDNFKGMSTANVRPTTSSDSSDDSSQDTDTPIEVEELEGAIGGEGSRKSIGSDSNGFFNFGLGDLRNDTSTSSDWSSSGSLTKGASNDEVATRSISNDFKGAGGISNTNVRPTTTDSETTATEGGAIGGEGSRKSIGSDSNGLFDFGQEDLRNDTTTATTSSGDDGAHLTSSHNSEVATKGLHANNDKMLATEPDAFVQQGIVTLSRHDEGESEGGSRRQRALENDDNNDDWFTWLGSPFADTNSTNTTSEEAGEEDSTVDDWLDWLGLPVSAPTTSEESHKDDAADEDSWMDWLGLPASSEEGDATDATEEDNVSWFDWLAPSSSPSRDGSSLSDPFSVSTNHSEEAVTTATSTSTTMKSTNSTNTTKPTVDTQPTLAPTEMIKKESANATNTNNTTATPQPTLVPTEMVEEESTNATNTTNTTATEQPTLALTETTEEESTIATNATNTTATDQPTLAPSEMIEEESTNATNTTATAPTTLASTETNNSVSNSTNASIVTATALPTFSSTETNTTSSNSTNVTATYPTTLASNETNSSVPLAVAANHTNHTEEAETSATSTSIKNHTEAATNSSNATTVTTTATTATTKSANATNSTGSTAAAGENKPSTSKSNSDTASASESNVTAHGGSTGGAVNSSSRSASASQVTANTTTSGNTTTAAATANVSGDAFRDGTDVSSSTPGAEENTTTTMVMLLVVTSSSSSEDEVFFIPDETLLDSEDESIFTSANSIGNLGQDEKDGEIETVIANSTHNHSTGTGAKDNAPNKTSEEGNNRIGQVQKADPTITKLVGGSSQADSKPNSTKEAVMEKSGESTGSGPSIDANVMGFSVFNPFEVKIVGGTKVTQAEAESKYPFYALYHDSNCGGSLIAPDIVLTAAHCSDTGKIIYLLSAKHGEGVKRDVVDNFKHPFYGDAAYGAQGKGYDFRLLRISESALVDKKGEKTGAEVVTLNLDNNAPNPGGDVQVVGFGITHEDGTTMSEVLNDATLQVVGQDKCASQYPEGVIVEDLMFCAAIKGMFHCSTTPTTTGYCIQKEMT